MNITLQQLEEWGACSDGKDDFSKEFESGTCSYAELYRTCFKNKKVNYLAWIEDKIFTEGLAAAVFWSEQISIVKEVTMPDGFDKGENSSDERNAQIGSSGYYARIGSSRDSARIGSSGYYARIGSSGDSARIGSSGDYARIGSSGYYARIGSSGDYARIGSSGYSAQIEATGKNAVVASAGIYFKKITLGEGGACAVAYKDSDGKNRFAVGYVGEGLEAGVPYRVNSNGEFIKLEDS